MNLILVITMPFGGYTERVLLTDLSGLTAAVESADFKGRIRLKADSAVNCRAVKRLAKIMDGEVKPCRSFLAGIRGQVSDSPNIYLRHITIQHK